jgi:hypothetical protein
MKDQMKETETNTNSETEAITDSTVTDEQAEATKGGGHVKAFNGRDGSLLS